jgi:drug/metabolite transporter (DMT)-like permease
MCVVLLAHIKVQTKQKMHEFIAYSLIASVLWGVMSITEAYVGGIYNEIGLVLKLVVFGLVGLAVVCINVAQRKSIIFEQAAQFARERPVLLVWMVVAVVLGACGTYFAYEAYRTCGKNRGLTVTITYAAPLVVVLLISKLLLQETLTPHATLGILLILTGIAIIDRCGIGVE